jgi:hypothetical protein
MYIRISAQDTPLCDPVADPHPRHLHTDVAVRRAGPVTPLMILSGLFGYMQEMDRQCGVNILLT